MPEATVVITCRDEKCGHQRTVSRDLFQRHRIKWVRCSKCGARWEAPHVAVASKSRVPLVIGISAALLCVVVVAVVAMNREKQTADATTTDAVPQEPEDPMAGTKRAMEKAIQAKADVEQQLTDLQPAIERFESDRDELKTQLNDMGIDASGDLSGNNKAQLMAKELVELVGQLRVLKKKEGSYTQARDELESIIRRLERKTVIEQLGLTEEELEEVTTTLDTIDVKIQVAEEEAGSKLSDLEADEVLDELLGGGDS